MSSDFDPTTSVFNLTLLSIDPSLKLIKYVQIYEFR